MSRDKSATSVAWPWQVGWFLHTPFPSSEIYRTLPVREEVLRAVLKADLIGFHTYDYARHFISSCTRILGLEVRRVLCETAALLCRSGAAASSACWSHHPASGLRFHIVPAPSLLASSLIQCSASSGCVPVRMNPADARMAATCKAHATCATLLAGRPRGGGGQWVADAGGRVPDRHRPGALCGGAGGRRGLQQHRPAAGQVRGPQGEGMVDQTQSKLPLRSTL